MTRGGPFSNRHRRLRVRLFVVSVLLVLAHETIPWKADDRLAPSLPTKLIYGVGLWQRPWNMFAPGPSRTTSWVSADVVDNNGQKFNWQSPRWAKVGPVEKFYRFRYLNYFNCFESPLNSLIVDDLADHIRRTLPSSEPSLVAEDVGEIRVSLKSMRVLLPPDGTLGPTSETYRMYSEQPLATRSFSP